MNQALDVVVRRSIERAPSSMRALAAAAGVSNVMLQGIMSGRERATPRVALKIAQVLEGWAKTSGEDAEAIRATVKSHKPRGGRR